MQVTQVARDSAPVDMLVGIGGTPEGVIAAAALKCLGGHIQGRLWPRNDSELRDAHTSGIDLDRVCCADAVEHVR